MNLDSILHGILDYFLYPVILIALVNMQQKRHRDRCLQKRLATLLWVVILVVFVIMVGVITAFGLPSWLGIPAFAFAVTAFIVMRKIVWPFKTHCQVCGEKLSFDEFLFNDGNICDDCLEKKDKTIAEPEHKDEPFIPGDSVRLIDFDEIPYRHKTAATFLFRENAGVKEVLLIENRRGFAKGIVSAPAGHIEAAETAEETAVREFYEETGIRILNPKPMAKARYFFTDSDNISTLFFTADEFEGEAKETAEALPFWCPVTELPLKRMWEDNSFWLKAVLSGEKREICAVYTEYELRSLTAQKEDL